MSAVPCLGVLMSAEPLKYLKTFQIAAQRGSFAAAAAELCVTASAVSHQIRRLEQQLGVALFERRARSLVLTDAGARYLAQLEEVFALLASATAQLRARFSKVVLRLQVPPFFSQELLLPRLARFSAAHPDADIQIATRIGPIEVHPADADVSVVIGDGHWPDLEVRELFAQSFVPACSPQLLEFSGVTQVAQLANESLIVHTRRQDLWERWAVAVGLPALQPRQQVRFDTMSAVVDAAERGVGFALVSAPLSRGRFARGALRRAFAAEITTGESYFVLLRPQDTRRPEVRALRDWLVSEFGRVAGNRRQA